MSFTGYLGATQVGSVLIDTTTPNINSISITTVLGFGGAIDRLVIKIESGNSPSAMLVDNASLGDSVSAVPEPSSMALMGIGAIGSVIAAYRRRRQAKTVA